MRGRAKRQLRVELLEERVLLATSAILYATPLASDPTAHGGASAINSYASPAQSSSSPSAEYGAGGDSDGSNSAATQEVVGPQLPVSSMKSGTANAHATSADSAYARNDNSYSSNDYSDKKETYQEKPVSMPSSAGTPLVQPHIDVAILVSAGRATAQSGLASTSLLTSAAASTQASTPAKAEPASPAGTGESAVAEVDAQRASAAKDTPSNRPLDEDGADESAKQETVQDDATSEALSAVSEQP